jgi:hypothetical protein
MPDLGERGAKGDDVYKHHKHCGGGSRIRDTELVCIESVVAPYKSCWQTKMVLSILPAPLAPWPPFSFLMTYALKDYLTTPKEGRMNGQTTKGHTPVNSRRAVLLVRADTTTRKGKGSLIGI